MTLPDEWINSEHGKYYRANNLFFFFLNKCISGKKSGKQRIEKDLRDLSAKYNVLTLDLFE